MPLAGVVAGRMVQGIAGPPCPLCGGGVTEVRWRLDEKRTGPREYARCPTCLLVFLLPAFLPTPAQERARYDQHDNNPDDAGYRKHLARLADPLSARLPRGAKVLDFGAGPTPGGAATSGLARLLEERDLVVRRYDPFYAPDESALAEEYDGIACSETVEHLHRPRREFELLDGVLRPGGVLGVMTTFLNRENEFDKWHYRFDPTHVSFYRVATFEWISKWRKWTPSFPGPNVALLEKSGRIK